METYLNSTIGSDGNSIDGTAELERDDLADDIELVGADGGELCAFQWFGGDADGGEGGCGEDGC